jgi:hypothetical protein
MPVRSLCQKFFRDEKSERFGFGLRASHSHSTGRLLVLSLLATLVTIVMWLLGYHAENKGLHRRYQAKSLKSGRVISYLTDISGEYPETFPASFKTNSTEYRS